MVPLTSHPFALTWCDGAILHWRLEPTVVRPYVPDRLELAVRDGWAWVGVLPFVARRVGLRGTPAALRLSFPECNLRTYVRDDDGRAVYFFSIDVGTRFGASLIRRVGGVPCYHVETDVTRTDERVSFASLRTDPAAPRARLVVEYEPTGEAYRADAGSLDRWLTSPRRFYASVGAKRFYADDDARLLTGAVEHRPWPLQPASVSVRENTLFEAAGFPTPTDDPHARSCERLPMTATVPRRTAKPIPESGTDVRV